MSGHSYRPDGTFGMRPAHNDEMEIELGRRLKVSFGLCVEKNNENDVEIDNIESKRMRSDVGPRKHWACGLHVTPNGSSV